MYYVAIGDLRMRTRRSFSIEVRPMMLYAPTGKLSALFYSNLQCFYGNFRGDNKLPGPGGIRKLNASYVFRSRYVAGET